jgi:hypothetical protein
MSDPSRSLFAFPRITILITVFVLFGLGLGIRLYDLTDLPLDFHPTRQLLSALKARGMYYQAGADVPDWQRKMAIRQWNTKTEVEPEVFEHLVAFTYRFTGEQFWIARVYSSLFWLIGGVFLFLLVRDLISMDAAVISTAYYLFFPYAVIASRSFQPDPLMVMLIISFWWAVTRWTSLTFTPSPAVRSRSTPEGREGVRVWIWTLAAGLLGGFAIYIKFVSVFFVVGAALGSILPHSTMRDLLRKPQIWVMAVLGLLPAGGYLLYGIVYRSFLGQQFSGRFVPALLISPINYINWAAMANMAVGAAAITLGLLGLLVVRDRYVRIFLVGLWAAYILFGLVFDYHIATHDYYDLPLIPIVAVSLAPMADWMMRRLAELTTYRWLRLAAYSFLLYGLLSTYWDVRSQLKSVDYRPQVALWTEIGDKLGHGPNVVALTQDYGSRLAYWGWQDAIIWPNSGDIDYHSERGGSFDISARFTNLTNGNAYFLVTDFDELDRQPELKKKLAGYSVFAEGDRYTIYDLQKPLTQ